MWSVLLDALKDSAIAAPFLLVIYLFIEFLEHNKRAKLKTVKLLNGKLAPLVAGGVGLIPQCGFSVMATDLYCQNYLKLGTLVAFFVATSDEALPILLTNSKTVGVVWIVLLVKVVYAVALGYLINLFDRRALSVDYVLKEQGCCHHDMSEESIEAEEVSEQNSAEAADSESEVSKTDEVAEHHEEHEHHAETHEHTNSRGKKFWNFVKHPLLHTLKIFVYIFVVNAIFGLMLFFANDEIMNFASQIGFFQCFLTALVGLIPNCASSVIITGMYAEGIVSFSAMLAGLVSNSGIALAILFKEKKFGRNFAIVGIMYLAGVVLGIIGYFVFPLLSL